MRHFLRLLINCVKATPAHVHTSLSLFVCAFVCILTYTYHIQLYVFEYVHFCTVYKLALIYRKAKEDSMS